MAEYDAYFGGHPLIDAIESSLGVLMVFALLAAAVSLVRPRPSSETTSGKVTSLDGR